MTINVFGKLPSSTDGFSYNSISSKDRHLWLLKSPVSFLPSLKDQFIDIPYLDGVIDVGVALSSRSFNLQCAVHATTEAELRTRLRSIAHWLNPLNGLKNLIFHNEDDKVYQARIATTTFIDANIQASQGMLTLPFICPDPHAYAIVDESTVEIVASFTFTRLKGNVNSYPIIQLKGTCDQNSTIGYKINNVVTRYCGDLAIGETLTIDHKDMSILKSSVGVETNVLQYLMDYDFPMLSIGDNTIEIVTTGAATFEEITLTARSRWI